MEHDAPLIGITTYSTRASWGVWELPAILTPRAYLAAVAASGGIPILLPSPASGDGDSTDIAQTILERIDGVIVCGGPDIDPDRYGATRDPRTGPADEERDAFELALLAGARDRDIPILGICRGMQMLNVAQGGTLRQHLAASDRHAAGPGRFARHQIDLVPGTHLAATLDPDAAVFSYHHQGIERLGGELRVAARAQDGEIEAIEDQHCRFRIGALWHPEVGSDLGLFGALVDAAAGSLRAAGEKEAPARGPAGRPR